MFYEPDTPWLILLPINHILGRMPLMKAYLGGSDSPTIPSSLADHKNTYFRHGHADCPGRQEGGSRLFMLNVHVCGSMGGHSHPPYPSKSATQDWQRRDKPLVKS
jgi:hypothetical protein